MKQKGRRFVQDDSKKNIKEKREPKPKKRNRSDYGDDFSLGAEDNAKHPVAKVDKKVTKAPKFSKKADNKAEKKADSVSKSKREKRKIVKQSKKTISKPKKASDKDLDIPKAFNKKTDRKVLSYEDLPLDDSTRARFGRVQSTFRMNRKSIVLSTIIIVLLVLCVLMFANRDKLSFSNIKNWFEYGVLNMQSEEQFPINIGDSVISDGNFTRIDGNLAFVSDTQFVTVNSYGRHIYNASQSFSNPVLVTSSDSDLSILYNLGGTGFEINSLDENIFKGDAEDNIFVADIAKDGTYAIVTQKDGYLSKLYVYSADNKQIFAYSFADYYITSVSINESGKTCALSGISGHDGNEMSAIYVLDFTKDEPVLFEEFENNIIYYIKYLNKNHLCAIGKTATYTVNTRSKAVTVSEYDGKTLTAFTVNSDTNTFAISLSRSADGRMCDILNFSQNGTLKSTVNTELKVKSLSTYKNRIAVLSDNTAYLFSKDGVMLSDKEAGLDPHSIVLYSKNDAYVLSVGEITQLDL